MLQQQEGDTVLESVKGWTSQHTMTRDLIRERLQAVTVPLTRGSQTTQLAEWSALLAPDGAIYGTIPCRDEDVVSVIGRGDLATIQVADTYVHRRHAQVRWDDLAGAHVVEDLGGLNGTYLNGERVIYPRRLRDGDHLRVGRTDIIYRRRSTLALVSTPPPAVLDAAARNQDTLYLADERAERLA